MIINWLVLGIVAFVVIVLLVYLIWKNFKDEKEVVKLLNDELKPEEHESEDDET